MWKPNQPAAPPPSTPDPRAGAAPGGAGAGFDPRAAAAGLPGDQATIGKSLVVKGEISGAESLYIDGKVEGSINLPGNRVTVGRNGQVAANITAREVVVLGKVRGNISASDRVDIRKQGTEAKPGPTAVSVPAATPEPVAAEG